MSQRFIAGAKVEEVLAAVTKLRKQGFAFTLDLLGEATTSERDADAYQQSYLNLIQGMATEVQSWSVVPRLDRDHEGSIPRVNLSLKLSALYSQFRPIDVAGTAEHVKQRLRPLLRAAREHDTYIHVDMEQYAYKDLTFQIFKEILMEDEFRDFPDVGIVVQAYLPEAQRDTEALLEWAEKRGTPIWVRLVKGAYWDYETIMAQAHGWPIPVYQQKWESDANFERLTRFLMENYRWLRPALGSHNLRSLSHGIACAKHLRVPEGAYELQMLYGMGGDQAQLLADRGQRVRIYTPFGELIPGMAYLVRRLLENTSNDSFLRQSFTEQVSIEELLMKPTDVAAARRLQPSAGRRSSRARPHVQQRAPHRFQPGRRANRDGTGGEGHGRGVRQGLSARDQRAGDRNDGEDQVDQPVAQVAGRRHHFVGDGRRGFAGHRRGSPRVQAMVADRSRPPGRISRAGSRHHA